MVVAQSETMRKMDDGEVKTETMREEVKKGKQVTAADQEL